MPTCRNLFVPCLVLALCGSPQVRCADSPATPTTAQSIYNAAQAAFDKSDWPAAIKGFVAIASPDDDGPVYRSQAIIHSRLAQAYARERMVADAEREAAIAGRGLGPQDLPERALLWLAIGEAQRYELEMTRAIESYGKGLEAAQQAKNTELITRADIGLALCYMTVSPDKAATLMDGVLAAPASPSDSKLFTAIYYDLRGRASLNLGNTREAMTFLTKAVDLSGGLSGSKVNLVQVGIRGDAALAAIMTNREERAREFLSWTGAGHLPSDEWTSGLGDPPVCSEAADIRPDDLVVVEFSIGADGQVVGAAPIYASRPGTLGIAFAQAVAEWKWNPERIATLPAFWRNMLRVELHCLSRPHPRGLGSPFRRDTLAWLTEQHVAAEDILPLKNNYVTKDDPRLERDDVAAIPALLARLAIETNHKRAELIFRNLQTALDKSRAPASARALALNLEPTDPSRHWSAERARVDANHVASMEQAEPHSAATAWITLEYAISLERVGRFKDARPVLERVLAYPPDVLGQDNPVRDVATLHLAALQRRAGDAAGADAKVREAGLTRAQCMMFDVRPVVTNNQTYSSDFPLEALRWGFDGYVRENFDINADGHVENARTIIAYPPFVFRSGAERVVGHFRYLAPVIDGVSAGCDGHTIGLDYNSH